MNDLSLYAKPRTFEEWSKGIRFLATLRAEMRWRIGDYLILGEDRFHDRIWQVADELGYTEGDLRNMMVVSRKFPKDERSSALAWSWHAALCPIPKPERDRVMSLALAGEINRAGIRALAHQNGKAEQVSVSPDRSIESNPLIESILLVGKLLSREAKGENVDRPLLPALNDLIVFAQARRAAILDDDLTSTTRMCKNE